MGEINIYDIYAPVCLKPSATNGVKQLARLLRNHAAGLSTRHLLREWWHSRQPRASLAPPPRALARPLSCVPLQPNYSLTFCVPLLAHAEPRSASQSKYDPCVDNEVQLTFIYSVLQLKRVTHARQ